MMSYMRLNIHVYNNISEKKQGLKVERTREATVAAVWGPVVPVYRHPLASGYRESVATGILLADSAEA